LKAGRTAALDSLIAWIGGEERRGVPTARMALK